MRKAALAGVRARAAMMRSPSFSRDSESRTTRGSPRAGGEGREVSEVVFFEGDWWGLGGMDRWEEGGQRTYRRLQWLRGWC
jgi:hypothetical protein